MDLKTVDLLQLQTNFMKEDKTTQAICSVLTPYYRQIGVDIIKCLIDSRVDDLPEEILDQLAVDRNIFWYNGAASIEVKRSLIKNAKKVFKYLGTPYSLERVIEDYFGDGVVEEWWEYGGSPYHFRVITTNSQVTGDLAEQFNSSIEKVKRKSTRLDEVVVSLSGTFNTYHGFAVHIGDRVTIRQEA